MNVEPQRPLQGLRILITRPEQQAGTLHDLLVQRGATVVRLPMVAIEPARSPALAQRLLQGQRDADAWIFTSANAVRFAAQLDQGVWPQALLAVGAATAAALQAAGRGALTPPQAFSSQGLLDLPELQDIAGRRYVIVTGADSLPTLAEGLSARGASVEVAEVYRRVPLPYPTERVLSALRGTQAIVLTSLESLEHLVRLTPAASLSNLLKKQLVVPSRRVVEKALELGFTATPLVPEHVSDAALVRCLDDWAAARGRPTSPDD